MIDRIQQLQKRKFAGILWMAALIGLAIPKPLASTYIAVDKRVLMLLAGSTRLGTAFNLAFNETGKAGPVRSVVAFDLLFFTSAKETNRQLAELGPALSRYDAMFSNSHNLARLLQLWSPGVPVVFEGLSNPIKRCLVDSFTRPARSATGYMHSLNLQLERQLQVLLQAFPGTREVIHPIAGDNVQDENCSRENAFDAAPPAGLCEPGERDFDAYVEARSPVATMAAMAKSAGIRLRFVVLCSAKDIAQLPHYVTNGALSGWVIPWHGLFFSNRTELVTTINRSHAPAIYGFEGFAKAGGLMSLTPITDTGLERPSLLALRRVLAGELPSEMPVQTPRGFNLVVNAKTASALALRPSLTILRTADEILY